MTETAHTRSRRASLGGLILQLVVCGGVLALSFASQSYALFNLAAYLLGGVLIWFVSLLVFRQRELAALEALDLEELRRERQTTGGGEAIFGEEGGPSLTFRLAETRLRWMQRWLIPSFGLADAFYLAIAGILIWRKLLTTKLTVGGETWPVLANVPVAMVVLAIAMLGIFLFSRYASGMGRVKEWQLLRGCGSYMLGNALAIMALLVCLGVKQYAGTATWEQVLAYVIPLVMIVLAIETGINFVLDIYRPRAPGVEPRACFDSRLLGLLAEPGGIAHTIAEAINYQFGFQVSQTWFYQLLQRTFVPLVATGGVALWLLTCLVIVQPYEHVIVTRFGRQLDPQHPLGPGLHWKLPWPIDRAQPYNTGQLHQFSVGFLIFEPVLDESKAKQVMLWTDTQHMGQDHFDFIICPTKARPEQGAPPVPTQPAEVAEGGQGKAYPVHQIRMEVIVQYRLTPEKLYLYSQTMQDPHRAAVDIAWEEVGRFNASSTADFLMGADRGRMGQVLAGRVARRLEPLGLEIAYVGVTNVHPEKSVAEAYREVISAEQQKVAAIREARVTESQRLSAVAGDATRARILAQAIDQARQASARLNDALRTLSSADLAAVRALDAQLTQQEALFRRRVEAGAQLDQARDRQQQVQQDFEIGMGQTLADQTRATQALQEAEATAQAAQAALDAAVKSTRTEAEGRLGAAGAAALLASVEARVANAYWDEKLIHEFTDTRLGGDAAAKMAAGMADRWQIEMKAAGEVARAQNEREAYRIAPQIYKTRRLIEVLVDGMKNARKYVLAFEPGQRTVRVRFDIQDQPGTDVLEMRPPERQSPPGG